MKHTIILNNDEASRYNSDDTITLMRPLKKQPPDGYENSPLAPLADRNKLEFIYHPSSTTYKLWHTTLQYPVGAKLGVREAWSETAEKTKTGWKNVFEYKADYNEDDLDLFDLMGGTWYSPAIMPKEAIMKHLIVLENTVKRVQELTCKDMVSLGAEYIIKEKKEYISEILITNKKHIVRDDKFINHFNSLYAKPRKQGDGFVCYPWDMDNWKKWYCLESKGGYLYKERNYKGEIKWYWKQKPLTIYPNAYFEFFKVRIE